MILKNPLNFPAKGAYIKAIAKVNDEDLIDAVKLEIENTIASNDIKIKSISIENFTVFKNEKLVFSDGLNVVIGENGTGKSHLLKLLYALIITNNDSYDFVFKAGDMIGNIHLASIFIKQDLINIFKSEKLKNLINHEFYESIININININLNKYSIEFRMSEHSVDCYDNDMPLVFFLKRMCFYSSKRNALIL